MTLLPFARAKRKIAKMDPEGARRIANREGVATCEKCLDRHPKAATEAPWSNVPRCRNRACNGLLIFPDTVKGTAK